MKYRNLCLPFVLSLALWGSGLQTALGQDCTFSVSAQQASPLCANPAGGYITLEADGAGPFSFDWSDGTSGSTRSGLEAGQYSVRISDGSGCTVDRQFTIAAQSGLRVSHKTKPTAAGQEVSLQLRGASVDRIVWMKADSPTALTANFSQRSMVLQPGSYQVMAIDAQGCVVKHGFELR